MMNEYPVSVLMWHEQRGERDNSLSLNMNVMTRGSTFTLSSVLVK